MQEMVHEGLEEYQRSSSKQQNKYILNIPLQIQKLHLLYYLEDGQKEHYVLIDC